MTFLLERKSNRDVCITSHLHSHRVFRGSALRVRLGRILLLEVHQLRERATYVNAQHPPNVHSLSIPRVRVRQAARLRKTRGSRRSTGTRLGIMWRAMPRAVGFRPFAWSSRIGCCPCCGEPSPVAQEQHCDRHSRDCQEGQPELIIGVLANIFRRIARFRTSQAGRHCLSFCCPPGPPRVRNLTPSSIDRLLQRGLVHSGRGLGRVTIMGPLDVDSIIDSSVQILDGFLTGFEGVLCTGVLISNFGLIPRYLAPLFLRLFSAPFLVFLCFLYCLSVRLCALGHESPISQLPGSIDNPPPPSPIDDTARNGRRRGNNVGMNCRSPPPRIISAAVQLPTACVCQQRK